MEAVQGCCIYHQLRWQSRLPAYSHQLSISPSGLFNIASKVKNNFYGHLIDWAHYNDVVGVLVHEGGQLYGETLEYDE